MLEMLSNMYVLPLVLVVGGMIVKYIYLRMAKRDDEDNKMSYFKCAVGIYLTSLATLYLHSRVSGVSQSGGSLPQHVDVQIPRNENFTLGKAPF